METESINVACEVLPAISGALTHVGGNFCGRYAKRTGKPCLQRAGHRTTHPGDGPCWLHAGRPIQHGRYSKIKRPRIRELIAQYEADPEPLNLLPELASARAMFVDFIERYDAWLEALLAWHGSFLGYRSRYEDAVENFRYAARTKDLVRMQAALNALAELEGAAPETPKPRQVLDIADARNTLLTIAKITETIERIRGNVSRNDLMRILTEMGRVVERHVPEQAVREQIKDGWLGIALA